MVKKLEGKISLSSCEILHIIGSLGKDDFFGIDDGFIEMDDMEINGAIARAENSLIDKELQELYYEKLSDIAREADRAFEEYKILVSYEKFGKLFEKYLLPEAIMV